MGERTTTANFRRAAAAAGALICLIVVLAMFLEPTREPKAAGNVDGFRFTPESVLGLFVTGLISSTFGGMLGMGGGVLKMSFLLLFFGFHPGVSRFAALLAYFVVAVGASYRYLKLRFVMMDVVKILVPSSIIGVIFGAITGHHLPRSVMTFLLGLFLLFIAVAMVRRVLIHYQDVSLSGGCRPSNLKEVLDHVSGKSHVPTAATWKVGLCGFPGGFLSAMLGISGGVVTTPLQQVLADIPIKNAIANTLLKACVTVPIACLMILFMGVHGGHFDLWTPVLVALCLIPGSIIGSQLGPAITIRMSPVAIHALFCAVSLLMGINMLFFSE